MAHRTTHGSTRYDHGRIVITFGVIDGTTDTKQVEVDVTPYVVPLARDLLIATAEMEAEYEEANETPHRCTGCGKLDHVHPFGACEGAVWVTSPKVG